jgi:hypothetical protein
MTLVQAGFDMSELPKLLEALERVELLGLLIDIQLIWLINCTFASKHLNLSRLVVGCSTQNQTPK